MSNWGLYKFYKWVWSWLCTFNALKKLTLWQV